MLLSFIPYLTPDQPPHKVGHSPVSMIFLNHLGGGVGVDMRAGNDVLLVGVLGKVVADAVDGRDEQHGGRHHRGHEP